MKVKEVLVVYTPNKAKGDSILNTNLRFGLYYVGQEDNWDRLCLVGTTDEVIKEMSVGISLAAYPENFSRKYGRTVAYNRAIGYGAKPFTIIKLEEFTQENLLNELYSIHDSLIKLPIKDVKRLISQQIFK